VTPHYGPWRKDIIQLLNDSLATELVCVLRYKRHHFTAHGLASPKIMSHQEKSTAIGAGAGAVGGAILTGGSTVGTVGGAVVRNAGQRCDRLPDEDRRACVARM